MLLKIFTFRKETKKEKKRKKIFEESFDSKLQRSRDRKTRSILLKISTFRKESLKKKEKIFEESFERNFNARVITRTPFFLSLARGSGSTGSNFRIHNRGCVCRLRKSFESYFVKSSNARRTHVRDRFSRHVFQSSARSPVKVSIPLLFPLFLVCVRAPARACKRGRRIFSANKGVE